MRFLLSFFKFTALIVLILASSVDAYEITKVIAVDTADSIPLRRCLRWSPDGTTLAYLKAGRFMLTDTLGNTRQVSFEQFGVHMFEWLSNAEIAFSDKRYPAERTWTLKMLTIDLKTGTTRAIDSCVGGFGSQKTAWSLNGPYVTSGGDVWYRREEQSVELPVFVDGQQQGLGKSEVTRPTRQIQRWGKDGLYEVSGDLSDSSLIVRRELIKHLPSGTLNTARTYLVNGGTLLRLSDSKAVQLDTMVGELPAGTTGCAIDDPSFNPKYSELLFIISCDEGHFYSVDRIGTFDFATNTFTVLDDLLQLKGCTVPVFAPDGLKIALLSDGKVYVVYREGL